MLLALDKSLRDGALYDNLVPTTHYAGFITLFCRLYKEFKPAGDDQLMSYIRVTYNQADDLIAHQGLPFGMESKDPAVITTMVDGIIEVFDKLVRVINKRIQEESSVYPWVDGETWTDPLPEDLKKLKERDTNPLDDILKKFNDSQDERERQDEKGEQDELENMFHYASLASRANVQLI